MSRVFHLRGGRGSTPREIGVFLVGVVYGGLGYEVGIRKMSMKKANLWKWLALLARTLRAVILGNLPQ